MAQDLASVGKKAEQCQQLCEGECSAAEGQSSSGPDQKVPLESSFFLSYPQLLEATHPNPACHMPSHRPVNEVARLPNAVSGCLVQAQGGSRLPNAVPGSSLK